MAGEKTPTGIGSVTSTLYLVGVGPGDPELLTLKAVRILRNVPWVAFPQLPGGRSRAYDIAKVHVKGDVKILPISLPMAISRGPAGQAYDQAALQISTLLKEGQSGAYLCEGDPFLYGSAMYLFERLSGQYEVQVIPGVNSINAASAALGRPLAARSERMKILPATLDDATLLNELANTESAAIIKTGKHLNRIRNILYQTGQLENAWIIENASCPEQNICRMQDYVGENLPYFATILCYSGSEPWGNKRSEQNVET